MSALPELPADELSAFLGAIAEEPDDNACRLVFADWLDEHNDPRGEFIRLKVAQQALIPYSESWRELRLQSNRVLAGFREEWVGPEYPEHLRGWYAINFPGGLPEVALPGWGLDESPDYPQDPPIRNCLRQGWVMAVRVRGGEFREIAEFVELGLLRYVSHLELRETDIRWPTRLCVLEECSRLRTLTIHAQMEFFRLLPHAATLPGVRKLSLAHPGDEPSGLLATGWQAVKELFSGSSPTESPPLHSQSLRNLEVRSSTLSEADFLAISALRCIQSLDLTRSDFRPAWLRHLAGMDELGMLDLSTTGVTDAGLRHLAALPKLRQLHLKNCRRVTDRGIAGLRLALPELTVERGLPEDRLSAANCDN